MKPRAALVLAAGVLAASGPILAASDTHLPKLHNGPAPKAARSSTRAINAAPVPAAAGLFTLTFEGLGNSEAVMNYYLGGTGGSGSGPGPNYGVSFVPNALTIIEAAQGGSGNFDSEPSQKTILFWLSGPSTTMNVQNGFTSGFSFYYASSQPGSVVVYDGLNATGNVLATIPLVANNPPVGGCPSGVGYCQWDPAGASFAGTARSVDFAGSANYVGFDNITFNGAAPGQAINCGDWQSEVGTWGPAAAPCGDLTSTATKVTYESASYDTAYSDFTFEAQVICTRPNQPTAANTVFVRGTPEPYQGAAQWWASAIAFNIALNGKYSVFLYQGTKVIPLQSWVKPVGVVVNPSGTPNTLRVEASGGTLVFSLNGTPVKTITGQTLLSGKLGLGMVRSFGTTQFGPNDTLVVSSATVTPGAPLRPARVSAAQEEANEAANRAQPRPDPFFAPASATDR